MPMATTMAMAMTMATTRAMIMVVAMTMTMAMFSVNRVLASMLKH